SAGTPARTSRSTGPSGQDLVDVRIGARTLAPPLLVLARQELADQPQREELHPDDHEQDAERQQGPVADRLAGDLERGQVDEDRRADKSEHEPEAAKEVERAVLVAAHER